MTAETAKQYRHEQNEIFGRVWRKHTGDDPPHMESEVAGPGRFS
jgi:hypothetical protein